MLFTVPWDCTLTGITWAGALVSASADYDVVLYDASSVVVASTSQDASWAYVISGAKQWVPFATPPTLTAGLTYRVVIKPTTTNTIRIMVPSFATSAIRAAVQSQATWQWTERTNAGAWTERPTQRAPMELHLASTEAVALGVDCLPIPVEVCEGFSTVLPGAFGGTAPAGTSGSAPGGTPNAIGCLDSHTTPPWNGGSGSGGGVVGAATSMPIAPSTCP